MTVSAVGSPGHDEEEYEPQYHPKADIGNIFGDSDKQKKKLNMVDDIVEEEQKNSREDTHGEEEVHNFTHPENTFNARDSHF